MAIFKNGNIITMSENSSVKSAQAFCVRDGLFFAVGSNSEVESLRLPGEDIVDLNGHTVVPGLIDSHMHFLNYAINKDRPDLSQAGSIQEIIDIVKEYITKNKIPEGTWVICRGWNENMLKDKRVLNRYDLDRVSTVHPIYCGRTCNHIAAVNSRAVEELQLEDIRNPEGGVIDRENGRATGVIRENALNIVFQSLPSMRKEEIQEVIKNAFRDALSSGLTTIHTEDAGEARGIYNFIDAYKELEEKGELPLRFVLQLNLTDKQAIKEASARGIKSGRGSSMLRIGALKLYEDGSLGGRTAAMEESYCDVESNGVAIYPEEELYELIKLSKEKGFQVAIHAIGDRAIGMILNCYERVYGKNNINPCRPVIIHCQFTNKELLRRFRDIRVIANVQPSFVMTDWPIVEKAVGMERAEESYDWKGMLDSGIDMCFSSDAPIESFNPMYGIYAAVTRKNLKGEPEEGFMKDKCISVYEALRAYTLGAAYMNFEEDAKGSIELGKMADFAVLSENIFEIHKESIKDVKVLETFVGGNKVYESYRGIN